MDKIAHKSLLANGLEPVLALEPGLFGTRWMLKQSDGQIVCAELVQTISAQSRALVENIHKASLMFEDNIVSAQSVIDSSSGCLGAIFPIVHSFDRILMLQAPFAEARLIGLMSGLASAVKDLHKACLTHGALAPHCVIGQGAITEESNIKISDLWWAHNEQGRPLNPDLAKYFPATIPDFALPFCAPEVLIGEAPTPESDSYSVGAILYYCATGAPPRPFVADNMLDRRAVADAAITDLKTLRPDLNPRLCEAIMYLLHADRSERPIGSTLMGLLQTCALKS